MCLEHKKVYLQLQRGKLWQKEGNINANENIILILFLKMLILWSFMAACGPTNSACMCVMMHQPLTRRIYSEVMEAVLRMEESGNLYSLEKLI